MSLVYFLVKKYFLSIFKNKTLRLPAIISLVSVFISVFSLIIVMFVMKGFEVKVQNKILNTFPHVLIKGDKNIDSTQLPNVEKIFKKYGTYGAIVIGKNLEIIELKAISNKIQFDNKNKKLPLIAISDLVQMKNNLKVGDRVSIYIPDFSGYKKIKEIRVEIGKIIKVRGSFPTIFFDFDKSFQLLGKPEIFTQIELKNPYESEKTISKIYETYPELKNRAIDWKLMNANLFNIMKLERFSLAIFLSFLILISATTIYSNTLGMISLRTKVTGGPPPGGPPPPGPHCVRQEPEASRVTEPSPTQRTALIRSQKVVQEFSRISRCHATKTSSAHRTVLKAAQSK